MRISEAVANNVSEKVFNILKGQGFVVQIYDDQGNLTIEPEKGTRFFVTKPNLMVYVDENEIRVNKSTNIENEDLEELLELFKKLAIESMISYSFKVFAKEIKPKDFAYQAKGTMNDVHESLGKLHGFLKTSYQTLGEVKLTYRHVCPVKEHVPSTRVRNIKSITLEHNGQKYDYPVVHVEGARALARHLNEGGFADDVIGEGIQTLSKKYTKLKEFIKYTKSYSLYEANEKTIELVNEKIKQMRKAFKEFIQTGNTVVLENFLSLEDTSKTEQLKNTFTYRHFDESFGEILPFIGGVLNERDHYEMQILENVQSDITLSLKPNFVFETMIFESPMQKLQYVLRELATCLDNQMLKEFLESVSSKLHESKKLNNFETKIIKEVFKRIRF